MDTLIPSSADLAGDPAVISRAEAMRPIVEAASDEIEEKRRLPPALLDKLHEARLFRLLMPRSANGIETDPDHLLPCDRGDRQGRRLDRLVPEPGRRLLDVGRLSRPCRWRRRSSATIRAPCWPGARVREVRAIECEGGYRVTGVWAFASGGRHATWLGAALPDLAGRRLAAARRQRPAGRAHHAGAVERGRVDRHLERRRPARHGERPVRPHRPFRARPTIRSRATSQKRVPREPARSIACRR